MQLTRSQSFWVSALHVQNCWLNEPLPSSIKPRLHSGATTRLKKKRNLFGHYSGDYFSSFESTKTELMLNLLPCTKIKGFHGRTSCSSAGLHCNSTQVSLPFIVVLHKNCMQSKHFKAVWMKMGSSVTWGNDEAGRGTCSVKWKAGWDWGVTRFMDIQYQGNRKRLHCICHGVRSQSVILLFVSYHMSPFLSLSPHWHGVSSFYESSVSQTQWDRLQLEPVSYIWVSTVGTVLPL